MTDIRTEVLRAVDGLIEEKVRTDSDGYAIAFYDLAKVLDIRPQAKSPKEVWETQMLPQIRLLLQLAPVMNVVGWLNEDELPDGYPYDEMFQHSEVHEVRLFPVFAPSFLGATEESPDARLKNALCLLREASLFIARYTAGNATECIREKIENLIFKAVTSPPVSTFPAEANSRTL